MSDHEPRQENEAIEPPEPDAATPEADSAADDGAGEDELLQKLARASENFFQSDLQTQAAPKADQKVTSVKASSPQSDDDPIFHHLDELANDMLTLMRRVRDIERVQGEVAQKVNEIHRHAENSNNLLAREVYDLRKQVVGEQRFSAVSSVTNELVPLVDRLKLMHAHLSEEEDARMISQLGGVVETLSASLRRLGCVEFSPTAGDAFETNEMQCVEYIPDAEPGVVIECVQTGYRLGKTLLRQAQVKVGSPQSSTSESQGDAASE